MSNKSISIVIPVYNSASILPELTRQLQLIFTAEYDYEIIFINDCSKDNSWEVIQHLALEFPVVRGLSLMRNYGQHNAVLCGMRAATKQRIITMDDDLQHPPTEIPRLLDKLSEGYDVVYGTPLQEQHGFFRDMASRITKTALSSAMGAETADKVSAFRALRASVCSAFSDYRSPFVSVDVLLTWGTTRFTSIPVAHEPRRQGVSNYTVRMLITHAFNMMTGFSVLPLQLASLLGFICAFLGLVVLLYVLVSYVFLGYSVPGFPFLASIISIFSGAQLLAVGIIGEYLARMHFRMMERPLYVVRHSTESLGCILNHANHMTVETRSSIAK